jgi:FlaA1/EpsC-like NDP-sugar epimerase
VFLLDFPLTSRRIVAFVHDLCALALCWFAAFWLRFNLTLPEVQLRDALLSLPWLFVIHAPAYWLFGLYRGIWRYASMMDLRRIVAAVFVAAGLLAGAVLMADLQGVPRSVLVLHPLLLILMMGGGRFVYRAWKDRILYGRLAFSGEPVLVIGVGDAADRLLRELNKSSDWRVVGLLDSDGKRAGQELRDTKILGAVGDIGALAARFEVRQVIVAMPEASAHQRRLAMEAAVQAGLSVMTVPSLDDMLSGRVAISQIRQIQLEDILGRDPVQLDDSGLRGWLGEHVVLVTGAGGSIGAELARQIAPFRPRLLLLFDLSEFALYRLEQEFIEKFPEVPIICTLGDVKDEALLDAVFSAHRPSVIFHAAAYKHVPLTESGNAWAAVQNNVAGSRCVAEAAQRHGVEKMVLVSTDKAVNPVSVMGASKRLAERVLCGLQRDEGTRFVTVRFGNVLGSSGSVIPKFREQIARGGPVTVTHPEIIRYFMLIPEAAQLVLQAGLMGRGGEIFVLDMGEPIRIVDLARDMIRLSGFTEDEIRIVYTGLRPGEKLYEELLTDAELTLPTPHPKLRVARAEKAPDAGWQQALAAWLDGTPPAAPEATKAMLGRFVPEYSPQP